MVHSSVRAWAAKFLLKFVVIISIKASGGEWPSIISAERIERTILYYGHVGKTGNHCLSLDFLAEWTWWEVVGCRHYQSYSPYTRQTVKHINYSENKLSIHRNQPVSFLHQPSWHCGEQSYYGYGVIALLLCTFIAQVYQYKILWWLPWAFFQCWCLHTFRMRVWYNDITKLWITCTSGFTSMMTDTWAWT